jgi:hypothetical protein
MMILQALSSIGYRPALPVSVNEFADSEIRARWIKEKGLTVFQMWSEEHLETPVDIFAEEPFPFDEEYERALVKPLHRRLDVRFVSIGTLIRMKEASDRPQDRIGASLNPAQQNQVLGNPPRGTACLPRRGT